MIRLLMLLVFLPAATGVSALQDRPRIDRTALERFKKLSPQEKQHLRERLKTLQSATPEERHRLRENLEKFRKLPQEQQRKLKEQFEKLLPAERKAAIDLASGFFKWAHGRQVENFPRQPFFKWAWTTHQDRIEELKTLDEGRRKEEFLRLAHEYRLFRLHQVEQHARVHKCITPEDMAALRDQGFQHFWREAEQLMARCPGRPKRPVPSGKSALPPQKPPRKQ